MSTPIAKYRRTFWLPLILGGSLLLALGVAAAVFIFPEFSHYLGVGARSCISGFSGFLNSKIARAALAATLPTMVFGIFSVSLLRQIFSTRRFLKSIVNPTQFDELPSISRARDSVELQSKDLIQIESESPLIFCAGFRQPKIFYSRAVVQNLNQSELDAVIAHEAHHLRSRDPLRTVLLRATRSAFFFLPIMKILEARFTALKEVVADEAATRLPAGRPALAEALYKLSAAPKLRVPSLTFFADRSILSLRISFLAGQPISLARLGVKTVFVSLVMFVAFVVLATPPIKAKTTSLCLPAISTVPEAQNLTNDNLMWNYNQEIFVHPFHRYEP